MPVTLLVKRLQEQAELPVVAHPGEDLAFDLYALKGAVIGPQQQEVIRTGIAVQLVDEENPQIRYGAVIRDRSSMGRRGLKIMGGEVDAGYRGEILVMIQNVGSAPQEIQAFDKIAQLRPVPILAGSVKAVSELEESSRGAKGFGSSGK